MSQANRFLSPAMKLALEWLPRPFIFMYPCSFSLQNVQEHVTLGRQTGWKFVPWYLSLIVVTGVVGLGSCLYVFCSYAFDFQLNSTQNIPIFVVILALALGSCAAAELAIVFGAAFVPEFDMVFNRVMKLVKEGKHSIYYFIKPLLMIQLHLCQSQQKRNYWQ